VRLRAEPEAAGSRLDAFLAGPLGSRTRAQRLIDAGAVRVDGSVVAKRHRLQGGEAIAVDETADPAAPAPVPGSTAPAAFGIAYEDEHLLVVDKPAGVVVHPARGNREGTLSQALEGRAAGGGAGGGDPIRPGLVHRLDKDTSGLLVVAKSEAVHRALKAALQAREITREYLALADGRPPARAGTIDAPIGRDRRLRTRMSTDTDEPRAAVTHFTLERALPRHSLLRVRLETGRTHQIRVHLQAIGHPVAGDPDYGRPGELGLTRQFLHATRLAFPHPVTGAPIACVSPLPEDLAAALERAAG
jgi:23S rRNA pseudouridine1911/1915/1917 synthase